MPNERNHLIHSYYYCTIYRKYSNLVKKLYYAESKSRKRDSHNLAVKNYYQLFSWQPKIGNLKGKTWTSIEEINKEKEIKCRRTDSYTHAYNIKNYY